MRTLLVALLVVANAAWAEGPWLSARGRLGPDLRLEAWGGSRTVGLGFVRPDDSLTRAWSAEGSVSYLDRTVELDGERVWQLTQTGFGTVSANAGASAILVPDASAPNLGLGPNAGVTLNLGGRVFSVDLGAQTGLEGFFVDAGPRFTERVCLGLNLRVYDFSVSLMGRAGADLRAGHAFVGRGEFVVSFAFFDLKHQLSGAFFSPNS